MFACNPRSLGPATGLPVISLPVGFLSQAGVDVALPDPSIPEAGGQMLAIQTLQLLRRFIY